MEKFEQKKNMGNDSKGIFRGAFMSGVAIMAAIFLQAIEQMKSINTIIRQSGFAVKALNLVWIPEINPQNSVLLTCKNPFPIFYTRESSILRNFDDKTDKGNVMISVYIINNILF